MVIIGLYEEAAWVEILSPTRVGVIIFSKRLKGNIS